MKPASITQKAWRKRNPDKVKEYAKKYYETHKEAMKKWIYEWNKKNPAKVSAYRKKHYLKNREKKLKNMYEWRKNNPEKVAEYYKKHNKKIQLDNKQEIVKLENKLKKYERGNPPYFYMCKSVKLSWTPKPITAKPGMIYCMVVMQPVSYTHLTLPTTPYV